MLKKSFDSVEFDHYPVSQYQNVIGFSNIKCQHNLNENLNAVFC